MEHLPYRNLTAKILAVVMAITLWIYVMNEQNPPIDANFQVPLEVRNLANSYVVQDVPEVVRIKVRGPRTSVAGASNQDVKAYLDLSKAAEGRQTIKIRADVPNGLDVLEIIPDRANIYIDKIVSRQLPVETLFSGTALNGLNIGKAVSEPAQVKLEGPRVIADTVVRILAHIDLNGKSGDFENQVTLIPINQAGQTVDGLTITPAKVNVGVSLLINPGQKTVDVKTLLTGAVPSDLVLEAVAITPDLVELYGEPAVLEKLEFVYTKPIVLTELSQSIDQSVELQLPPGVTARNDVVVVHIEVAKK